ncbi:hypothetical protein KI387_025709 [Taxus chinensis]|uniref:ABC1 atypical kinase-like domain-containing protein n=1 Tax=Taxus chinensis TaxID=29808 RepID=A0AA38FUI4_TAXCH|nr:hypothetical protein KI387_025709 [Taxus chinensis]
MNWRLTALGKELDRRASIKSTINNPATRYFAYGSIGKIGHGFSTRTLQDIAVRTHGNPSTPGLPTVLWNHFRLYHSQHKSYWCRIDKKYGSMQEDAKRAHSIQTLLRFSKLRKDLCGPQNSKGFFSMAKSPDMAHRAQTAWKRLSLMCFYGGPTFLPISRLTRAVSLACYRSHLIPRILALIIGEASWAHNRSTESEELQANFPPNSQAPNRHGVIITSFWSLVEGIVLVLRALYLLTLFSPAIILAPFADIFGGRYRQLWLQLVHRTLEKGGAAFIKWGQWAATRPDLFPRDLCNELAKLHTQAPAHKFAYTRQTIEKAFGRKIDEIFEDFEEEPVASGSIAQVHRASLKFRYPGQKVKPMMVAVKVRHPGVSEVIRRDFVIINWVAKVSTMVPALKWLRLDESVQQFAVFMLSQVDLAREAAHLSRFLYNFRRWKDVSFPKPLYPLVHPAVLVETYEQGESVARYVDQPEGKGRINKSLAHIGTHTLLKMLLVDNFIHADMHPGNILVRVGQDNPSNKRKRFFRSRPHVVFLDVGMTAELSNNDRLNLLEFFKAVALRDGRKAAECTLKFSKYQSCPDRDSFIKEIETSFKFWGSPEGDVIHPADCMQDLLEQVRRHKVNIDGNVCTVMVTTLVLEIKLLCSPRINDFIGVGIEESDAKVKNNQENVEVLSEGYPPINKNANGKLAGPYNTTVHMQRKIVNEWQPRSLLGDQTHTSKGQPCNINKRQDNYDEVMNYSEFDFYVANEDDEVVIDEYGHKEESVIEGTLTSLSRNDRIHLFRTRGTDVEEYGSNKPHRLRSIKRSNRVKDLHINDSGYKMGTERNNYKWTRSMGHGCPQYDGDVVG